VRAPVRLEVNLLGTRDADLALVEPRPRGVPVSVSMYMGY